MKTVTIRKEDLAPGAVHAPEWLLVDAKDQVLGRLASQVANLIRGKHKPIFTPHLDTGDFVIVINADKVRLTGSKLKDKLYWHHTGFPGGIKSVLADRLLQDKPTELVRLAVKRMLPKNALYRKGILKLKIFAGEAHPHQAQQPRVYELPY
ncbi:MAG: 50S ribosomal protein L13 [Deltaproteobacteria bacterium]|nr:50S ribosomal protein L13 [Deltaproteobacteria bacterium]